MQRILVLAAAFLGIASVSVAQTMAEQELLDRQQQRYAAAMAQDIDQLERMVVDELRYCHTTGAVDTKTSYLETVRTGGILWLAVNPSGMEARVQIKERQAFFQVGVIAGEVRQQITVGGRDQPIDMHIRTIEVYLKRDGRWQLSEFQASNVR